MSDSDTADQQSADETAAEIAALEKLFAEQEHDDAPPHVAERLPHEAGESRRADDASAADADHPGGDAAGTPAWTAHGGDAPSRGAEVAGDGMSESAPADDHSVTGPDGEALDGGESDGGESGQDSGSMS